jgi:hypothetical protein
VKIRDHMGGDVPLVLGPRVLHQVGQQLGCALGHPGHGNFCMLVIVSSSSPAWPGQPLRERSSRA